MERWITELKARGWGSLLSAALDVLEPFGAFGAQALWIMQPFLPRDALAEAADLLEHPGGIAHLRRQLERDDDETQH